MEIRFYIDVNQEALILKFSGKLTFDRWYRGASAVWDHKDYQKSFDGIVDFRSSELDMKTADVKKIVEIMQTEEEKAPRGKAVILVSEPMAAALGSIFSDNVKDVQTANIVLSEDDALKILNLQDDLFRRVNTELAEVIHIGE